MENGVANQEAGVSQNYIFRLHQSGESNVQLECWQKSKKITDSALSTVQDSVKSGSGKVATSVPSPFARMHLFETAFNIVSSNEVDFVGTSMYHQLVSDCLDMFQLIFSSGGDSNIIKIVEWNKTARLETLRSNGDSSHTLLAETLSMFLDGNAVGSMAGTESVYFIYYKDVLVGGTSPLTMFFTGANWHREMKNNMYLIRTTTEDVLFDDEYAALHERDDDFVDFMVKFHMANASMLQAKCPGLERYLRLIVEQKLPEIQRKKNTDWRDYLNNSNKLLEDYKTVETGGANTQLRVGGINILRQAGADISESDLTIEASVNHYANEPGSSTSLQPPLVLIDGMDVALKYIKTNWDKNTKVPYPGGVPLSRRMLPETDISYPYVTTDDFLSDRLVKLPFKVNKEAYVTNCDGDFEYLLPIKPLYFKFFTTDDLEKHLRISRSPDGAVSVNLDIPIKNHNKLTFSKTYPANHELIADARMSLGIFPFYRLSDCDDNIKGLHEYSVFLADKTDGSDIDLNFLLFSSINPTNNNYDGHVEALGNKRSNKGTLPGSTYYRLKSEFDAIEVRVSSNGEPFTGMIIPKFNQVKYNSYNNGKFTFAIDFGTSNTHVAYTGPQNNMPESFGIGEQDKQMVLLSDPNRSKSGSERYQRISGSLPQAETLLKREYVPSLIGDSHNSHISFPIRTASCELANFDQQGQNYLFGSANIGFSIDEEDDVVPGVVYTTNLKWLYEKRQNPKDSDRLRLYFKELLWMIKNKVLQNGGDLSQLRILWLLPESADANIYSPNWESAASEVFGSFAHTAFEGIPVTESVAPYFYLRKASSLSAIAADAINIDIGGGTTDVMYFNPKASKYFSTSFRFAGNDIWGEGLLGENSKENGFISNFMRIYESSPTDKNKPEDGYLQKSLKDPNLGSEDVISLLFKYDQHFKFIDSIHRGNPDILFVLYLHYGALIYHLVQLIDKQDLEIPRYFTFSGKGSQYINLMCSQAELTKYTIWLIKAFTEKAVPAGFKVVLNENPKQATANGAILFDRESRGGGGAGSLTIDETNTDSLVYYGQKLDYDVEIKRTTPFRNLEEGFLDSVTDNVSDFVEKMLTNEDIMLYLNSKRLNRLDDVKEFLLGENSTELGDSLDAIMINKRDSPEFIKETFFFFPLKNTLYNLGRYLAGGTI